MRSTLSVFILAIALSAGAQTESDPLPEDLATAVQQLRDSVGRWSVVTEFLNDDGSVAGATNGTYEFGWVVPDRVLSGRTDMPELNRSAGILFYVNEKDSTVEMVSVGADGRLWIMTGPAGEETRYTRPFKSRDGKDSQLRFTRYNVQADAFESKMEYTQDGGQTWLPGNHQLFRRADHSE